MLDVKMGPEDTVMLVKKPLTGRGIYQRAKRFSGVNQRKLVTSLVALKARQEAAQ